MSEHLGQAPAFVGGDGSKSSELFDWEDARMKVTLGSNNIFDEEAPLADDTFGYDPDVHNNYGRSIYLDVRASF